ncbi:MAG: hypothetical protein U1E53_30360 [Dongiaceae bacterium]
MSAEELDRLRRCWPEGRRSPPSACFDSWSVPGADGHLRFAVVRLAGGHYLRLDGHLALAAFGASLEAVLPPA